MLRWRGRNCTAAELSDRPLCAALAEASASPNWGRSAAYRLEPAPWPPQLEQELARIDADVPPSWYRAQHDAGRLAVLAVTCGNRPLAWLLTRIDDDDFVIVAAVSSAPDHTLTRAVLPLVERRAKQLGCAAVRMHTRRWGLVAIAGYPIAEIILRKVL